MIYPAEITYGDILRVRREADINLLAVVDGKSGKVAGLWETLCADLELRFRVLYAWLAPTFTANGITEDEFLTLMTGAEMAKAFDALAVSLDFFFKATGTSHLFGATWMRAKNLLQSSGEAVENRLLSLDDASLLATLNANSGETPGSVESTRASTPTGN